VDLARGEVLRELATTNDTGIDEIAVHPSDRIAVATDNDNAVLAWNVDTGACTRMLGHTNRVRGIARDATRVVSASFDRTLRVWDIASGTCTAVLEGHPEWVLGVVLVDGNGAVSWDSKTLRRWDLATGTCAWSVPTGKHLWRVAALDGDRLVCTGDGGAVAVVRTSAPPDFAFVAAHGAEIYALEVDGDRVLTTSADRTVALWRVTGTALELRARWHGREVTHACFTGDGRIAYSDSHGEVVVLEPTG
jgi:WD40 repeat protein